MRYIIELLFVNIRHIDFLSWRFWFLFACVSFIFWILPQKCRKGLLLVVSFLFYFLNGVNAVALLIYLIVFSWLFAFLIEKNKNCKALLCIAVIVTAMPFLLSRLLITKTSHT